MKRAIIIPFLALAGCLDIPPITSATSPAFIGLRANVESLYSDSAKGLSDRNAVERVAARIAGTAASVPAREKREQLQAVAKMLRRHSEEHKADAARGKPWTEDAVREKYRAISIVFDKANAL
ncbi:MAG: hypothetical protein O3B01_32195 [Planctomycetota bacterium]|nr:hypothetical protein [Planctomycetota bacterium]MDA1143244.1 hypothetical protein [Planctomycetota bacterium]